MALSLLPMEWQIKDQHKATHSADAKGFPKTNRYANQRKLQR